MNAAQLAQTHESLEEIGALNGDNCERILTAFLSLGGAPQARDWTRLMISVARGRPSELPYLLECVRSVIVGGDWRGSEVVEVLHCMAITSYKDTQILKTLGKGLRAKILAERSASQKLKLSTAAITHMSAIRTMLVIMEELLNDVTELLRSNVATSIQIHQILSALVRQDEKLITRPSRGGYRELVALCEDQWCRLATTEKLSERAFLSTTVLFAEVARGALTERLSLLVLDWAAEGSRIPRLNVLDAIQLTGLLSKICNSTDAGDTERSADLIDAVYDHASHELNLRDWPPSEFSVFVSNLASAGDCGLYDAEGLSHTISLHVQRKGHGYDCRHLTLVTDALSKLSNRVQDVNSLGPLWHEISERLLVFQAKQLLAIGVAMSKFTAETVTAIQYRNFPTLTGAFLNDANLLSSLDTCSRVDLIASWSRVGGLTGSLLEAVATGITGSTTFKKPGEVQTFASSSVRDASRVLFSLYCINLHSLTRNTGPNTQALVRHCRNSLEAEAPFSRSIAPEDLVRAMISLCASSVLSEASSSCRADLVAYSAFETLIRIHFKWLVQFLDDGGPSRSMFTMALAWLSPIKMIEKEEVLTDALTMSRLLDILRELNIPVEPTSVKSLKSSGMGADELTMEEQSIYRRLGSKGLAMVSSPPFTIRLATTQMVAIEILSDREVLGQREDLVAWTKIRLSLLLNRGWKIVMIRPSERKGLVNADSLYELALNKLQSVAMKLSLAIGAVACLVGVQALPVKSANTRVSFSGVEGDEDEAEDYGAPSAIRVLSSPPDTPLRGILRNGPRSQPGRGRHKVTFKDVKEKQARLSCKNCADPLPGHHRDDKDDASSSMAVFPQRPRPSAIRLRH
ncbi:hypothetical protein FOL47_007085 [Perkinsus chesapeaki]|uniref:Uncharacterized protein n=1 Tax=Perkinsus chesapeaki TaxID=330153 RepID=A0A7J6LMT0_PERCH|nr:hypothetical protein FOL47_007085 [Perkinsus chesapeaki]